MSGGYDDESFSFGLGFGVVSSGDTQVAAGDSSTAARQNGSSNLTPMMTTAAAATTTTHAAVDDADELMRQYMQQCLEYHADQRRLEKEEELRKAQASIVPSERRDNGVMSNDTAPLTSPLFIPSRIPDVTSRNDGNAQEEFQSYRQQTIQENSSNPSVENSREYASVTPVTATPIVPHEALAKAAAIVKGFQQSLPTPTAFPSSSHMPHIGAPQSNPSFAVASTHVPSGGPSQTFKNSSSVATIIPTSHSATSIALLTPQEFLRRRRACFQVEQERLHLATMRNFAYVEQKEKLRYQQQLDEIEHHKRKAQELEEYHQRQVVERKRQRMMEALSGGSANTNTSAGLGSKKRQQIDRRQQKQGASITAADYQTVSIYLAGLSDHVEEDTLRQMFGGYGNICKVHFYRDKKTRKRKGDALLVYKMDTSTSSTTNNNGKDDADAYHARQRGELIQSVCGQMNGAELPDGSVLSVQPANSEKEKTKLLQSISTGVPSSVLTVENSGETKKATDLQNKDQGTDDGEDLDDFFASLE